jgi:FkbM family methyltransferase
MRAFARVLIWQIRSRVRDEVIMPWVCGQRLVLRRGMTGATGNIYVGLHEFADMMFLLHFLRPSDLFLDVGANVGAYTILASGACGATTMAFEPDPYALAALRRNVEVNNLCSRVELHPIALGPTECAMHFTIGLDTKNRIAAPGEPSQVVRQMPLDAVIGNRGPIFIKLDVEHYEEQVLEGAQSVISQPSLQVLATESTSPNIRLLLASLGFKAVFYEPFQRRITADLIGVAASNVLFVRDVDFITERIVQARKVHILGHSI